MEKEMPEGVKWPQFKAGGPVGIGAPFTDRAGTGRTVMYSKFYDGNFSICADDGTLHYYEYGEQVAPTPVIAADGEPLKVGQTVWRVDTGVEYWVKIGQTITSDAVVIIRNADCDCESEIVKASQLTHQRPVLDADGVPTHEGDTVYLLPGEWCGEYPLLGYSAGDEMVVKELCPGHEVEGVLMCVGVGKFACFPLPYQFTHTKPELPDTWERIEEDVDALVDAEDNGVGSFNAANDYCERHGLENGTVWVMMARDLVRRCREVAERERGE